MTKQTSIVFGSKGNLGPTWVKTLNNIGHQVIGFGLREQSTPVEKDSFEKEYHVFDLRTPEKSCLLEIMQKHDVKNFVFNAGVDALPGEGVEQIEDFSIESWSRFLEINVLGIVATLNFILSERKENLNIILIGSMYANYSPNPSLYSHFNGGKGAVKHPAYSTSKAALKAINRQYAVHLAKYNSRVNMINPGGIFGKQDLIFREKFDSGTPLGRMGNNNELEASLRFLVDESNTYFTGQEITVDGGFGLC